MRTHYPEYLMIKGADTQGRWTFMNLGTPRLDKASLNEKARRRIGQIKKMNFLDNYTDVFITSNHILLKLSDSVFRY